MVAVLVGYEVQQRKLLVKLSFSLEAWQDPAKKQLAFCVVVSMTLNAVRISRVVQ